MADLKAALDIDLKADLKAGSGATQLALTWSHWQTKDGLLRATI